MSNSAYQALTELAAKTRKSSAALPENTNTAPRWSGIGFSLLGHKFVVPMGQISELMNVPSATTLPGVQPWVVGLANVRGRLLPLFDLAVFFGGSLTFQKKQHRVLVLETDSFYSGLVVDQSHGMQHFDSTEHKTQVPSTLTESLSSLVNGSFSDDNGETWSVFDFNSLAGESRFANAGMVYPVGF